VIADGLVFLTSAHGRSRPLRAVSVRAQGTLGTDVEEEEHLIWNLPRRGIYAQTPIVYGGLLYSCADNGALGCYDPATGEEIYRHRLGSGRTGFSGSAVAADGKLYFSGENGEIFIVRAGRDFEVIAINDMGETCMATPAISQDTLYFRTRRHVVAIRTDQFPR
jgi:outer membrane protein assembly factor BamB